MAAIDIMLRVILAEVMLLGQYSNLKTPFGSELPREVVILSEAKDLALRLWPDPTNRARFFVAAAPQNDSFRLSGPGLPSRAMPSARPCLDAVVPFSYNPKWTHMIEVLVYSKPGCCLCGEVKTQLVKLQDKCHFDLREKNILENPQAFA